MADVGETLNGLVLTGGGARGAYQAGALLALAKVVGARRLPFPVLSGASAGSLNVAFLATRAANFGDAARSLADLWSTLEPNKIFRTDASTLMKTATDWAADLGFGGWIGSGRGRALLDTGPLRELLVDQLDFDAIHANVARGDIRGIGVTATNYQTGLGVTFFDSDRSIPPWSRATRIGVHARLTLDHVIASAAIPMFFPAVAVEGAWYADGCIRLSTPLSPAIRMGARRILAIAVRPEGHRGLGLVSTPPARGTEPPPSLDAREPSAPMPKYPSVADTAGVLLDALFLDALEADVERTSRINETLSLLPPNVAAAHLTPLHRVDVMVLRPSVDPASLVLSTLDHFPVTVRHLFRGLGASDTTGWDLLSYVAFEGVYTTRLMQLGYEDTLARAEELRAFLHL